MLDMKAHSLRDCSDLKRATAIDAYAAYKEESLPDTLLGEANIQEGSLRLSLFGSLDSRGEQLATSPAKTSTCSESARLEHV